MTHSIERGNVADRLATKAARALGDQPRVRRWLGDPSALAGGDTPIEACEAPEVRRRLEQQLDWFAGTRRPPG